jgi:hypothetical protein
MVSTLIETKDKASNERGREHFLKGEAQYVELLVPTGLDQLLFILKR